MDRRFRKQRQTASEHDRARSALERQESRAPAEKALSYQEVLENRYKMAQALREGIERGERLRAEREARERKAA